jgi:AcrR family transcriptional regulator
MGNRIGRAQLGAGAPAVGSLEDRVLEATRRCCDKWGIAKVTVEDIAAESGVSRATIYRMFPGGKDVLFDALRVRELEDFFATLRSHVEGADSLEDLLVRTVVAATRELRADDHLALMLASEPGDVLGDLTVAGLPRIIRVAVAFIAPLADPYLPRSESRALIDVLARLTISYFLSPSDHVDLGDEASARRFLAPVLRAFQPALHTAS